LSVGQIDHIPEKFLLHSYSVNELDEVVWKHHYLLFLGVFITLTLSHLKK